MKAARARPGACAAACTPLQAITETSAWPWGERPAIDFNGLYFDRTDNGHSYYADTDATIHGPTTTAGTFESNCKVTSTGSNGGTWIGLSA